MVGSPPNSRIRSHSHFSSKDSSTNRLTCLTVMLGTPLLATSDILSQAKQARSHAVFISSSMCLNLWARSSGDLVCRSRVESLAIGSEVLMVQPPSLLAVHQTL